MHSLIFMFFSAFSFYTQTPADSDSVSQKATTDSLSLQKDTTTAAQLSDSTLMPDSIIQKDTLIQSVSDSDSSSDKKAIHVPSSPVKDTSIDSSFSRSRYIGIGVGWSLGSFTPSEMWENTLADSLSHFHLTEMSFSSAPDTNSSDSLIRAGDVSKLRFRIKDKPSTYNMAFPFSVSFTKFNKDNRHSVNASFYIYSKKQNTSISIADNDSLSRRIDIKQKFITYSASLHYLFGRRIPIRYISVDGVNRTDIMAGIGVSPLLSIEASNSVKAYSDDLRIKSIADTVKAQLHSFSYRGLSLSMKAGVSTVRHLKKGSLDASIMYSFSWNDYFYDNGKRVTNSTIDPASHEPLKELSFISNRLEISFSILGKLADKK